MVATLYGIEERKEIVAEKPTYGFIGDPSHISGELLEELHLVPLEGRTDGLAGVLIAGGDVQPTKEQLAEYLQSGLSVAVAGASPGVTAALEEITGYRQLGASPLVVYSPVSGPDSRSYSVATAGASSAAKLEAPHEGGDASLVSLPMGDEPCPASVQPGSPQSLFQPVVAPRALLRDGGYDSLVPASMSGVAYGTGAFKLLLSGLINQPSGCDNHINDGRTVKQQYRGQVNGKFHFYWVDGDNDPHFMVILKQSIDIDPAESGFTTQHTWTWDGWSKGYIMYALDYEPCTLSASGARRVRLESWAPRSNFDESKGLGFSHPMSLRVNDGQGARSAIVSFTAASDAPNSFKGWSCKPRVNTDAAATSWRFHQRQCWDPTTQPPHLFGNWYPEMYKYGSRHGYVRDDFPEQSRTPFSATAISAWRIDCDRKPGPKGAPVPAGPVRIEVGASVWARFALFHCRDGCNQGRNHLFMADYGTSFRESYQLDELCKPR